jgi:hypothetical protein
MGRRNQAGHAFKVIEVSVCDQDGLQSQVVASQGGRYAIGLSSGVDGTRPALIVPDQIAVGLQRSYGEAKHVHGARF